MSVSLDMDAIKSPPASAPLLVQTQLAKVEAPATPPTPSATVVKQRPRFDYGISLERNYVTPARAISDFLLTEEDLKTLPEIKRRSPYAHEPVITVYYRRDVEAKALQIYGSHEAIVRERIKRETENKDYKHSKFSFHRLYIYIYDIKRLFYFYRCVQCEASLAPLSSRDRTKQGQWTWFGKVWLCGCHSHWHVRSPRTRMIIPMLNSHFFFTATWPIFCSNWVAGSTVDRTVCSPR